MGAPASSGEDEASGWAKGVVSAENAILTGIEHPVVFQVENGMDVCATAGPAASSEVGGSPRWLCM